MYIEELGTIEWACMHGNETIPHHYHSQSIWIGGGQSLSSGVFCYLKGVGGMSKHWQVVVIVEYVDSHLSLRLQSRCSSCLLHLDLKNIKE